MTSGSEAAATAYRDQDEIDDAIAAWSENDYVRMMARASAAAVGTDMEAEDVLAEAIKLAMGGRRPWKAGVPFEAHMTMVMKGIGFNRRRSLKTNPVLQLEALGEGGRTREATPANDVLSTIQAKQLEAHIEAVFADDAVGWAIFMARRVEQMSVEESCEFAGIPRGEYESVLKRVNRKLAKAVESGAVR